MTRDTVKSRDGRSDRKSDARHKTKKESPKWTILALMILRDAYLH